MTETADLVLAQGTRTFDVLRGTLTLRRAGVWRAELELATTGVQKGAATLRTRDGAVAFVGYTKRGGDFLERARCVVWGGAGGVAAEIAARYHVGPRLTPRLVLRDLLRDAGEALDETATQPELDADLPAWVRKRGPAVDELWRLCDRFGWVARALPNGKWFVGAETWREAAAFEYDLLDDHPGEYSYLLGLDAFAPELLPGRYFAGRKVAEVVYTFGDRALRAGVLGWRGEGFGDATEQSRALIRATAGVGPDGALYRALVVQQNADGTLDVLPQHDLAAEARTLPPLTKVPLRGIAPGVTATVPADAVVLVGFEGGLADRPHALLFDTGTLNLSGLKLGANATKGAARGDDPTSNGSFTFAGAGAVLTITYTPPGGAPQVTTLTFAGAGVSLTTGGTANVSGKIDAGSVSTITLIE